jgi:hypothetical protein
MVSSIPSIKESKPVFGTKTCPLALIKQEVVVPWSKWLRVVLKTDL